MAAGICGWGLSAAALDLSLPKTAEQTFATVQDPGAYALPVGPWANGTLPVDRVEGRIQVESWHVPQSGLSPFQVVQPLRDALAAEGYEIMLDCASRACGGFDFRFGTLVLPAPEMYVSLDDYHFVAARSEQGAVSLLASRGAQNVYVQIIRAGQGTQAEVTTDAATPAAATPDPARTATPLRPTVPAGDVAQQLETAGHVVLSDVIFASGSTALGAGAVASLDALADYLKGNTGRRVMIVGHTDATGSLAANRAVSLKRAQATVSYLTAQGVAAGQVSAEGAGYMAPVASNLTEAGRDANRRVEAVMISTQ